ncbi:translesion DNA synthesis-associated protein ImuA [Acidithiobacillus sp.]|uniref:translesion DNA synthesis-associated protein ImuA n=1 Tax=Acidithiobacillus sp. TaxID=1872118 RepID=UPI003D034504
MSREALQRLLQEHPQRLWRGQAAAPQGVATAWPALDTVLGEWPRGALTEIYSSVDGIGELRLVLPAVAELSRREKRWVLWLTPPYLPYAPALAAAGIDLSRMLLVHPRKRLDSLWVLEQALRGGTCSAVLAWPPFLAPAQLRRLQLAAEEGQSVAFFFHKAEEEGGHSLAALRLRLAPTPSGLRVQVRKRRAGLPGEGELSFPEQMAWSFAPGGH